MSIQIDVPYQDKDRAKSQGAFWDTHNKTWYIPNTKKIANFVEWLPEQADMIIKAPILVAKNSSRCWKCGKETPLIAMGGLNFIMQNYSGDNSKKIEWSQVSNRLFLFSNITYLPKQIIDIIQSQYSSFKLTYSRTVQGKYWANTCIHCNSLQGDFFNHNEPDGAFFPMSKKEGLEIELLSIAYQHDIPIVGGNHYRNDVIPTHNIQEMVQK